MESWYLLLWSGISFAMFLSSMALIMFYIISHSMLSPNQRENKVLETRSLAFSFTTLFLAPAHSWHGLNNISFSFPFLLYSFDVSKSTCTKPTSHFFTRPDLSLNKYLLSANCKPSTGLRVGTDKRQMRHCLIYGNVHVYWGDE